MVMAALRGSVALFLACALPSRLLLRAEGDPWAAPCEEQQRYRQNRAEPEVVWGSTVAVLSILSVLMMLFQLVHFINKDPCPQERKECEMLQEDCQETGKKTDKGRSTTCSSSQALLFSPARGEPCPSECTETQQAYVRQLACMEQQLEALLSEVRSQKSILKDTLMENESPMNTSDKGSDKLRITVYEIADCEVANNVQPRGRKRQI